MKRRGLVFAVLAGCLGVACGGTAKHAGGGPSAPGHGDPAAPAAGPPAAFPAESGADADVEAPRGPAPSAAPRGDGEAGATAGSAFEEKRAADAERPGLGTSWGESRTSEITTAPFEREHPSRPIAVGALYYNDASGARAMARRAGVSHVSGGFVSIDGGALAVRLVDSAGGGLPGYGSGDRAYVVGERGARYAIQIRNNTGNRYEVVATVDGLDVIDGRPGAYEKRGYILSPWATLDIDGFRRSETEVAAFRFGSVSGSYAASKGGARNVGVIGVAFFQEAGSPWPWSEAEVERREGADPFPGRFATPPRGVW